MSQSLKFLYDQQAIKESFEGGLGKTLGFEFVQTLDEGLEIKIPLDERHARSGGIANGGVALAVLESLGSISAFSIIDYEKFNALGTSVTMNHIKPGIIGETLTAKSKALHIGRTTHVWEINIYNSKNQLTSSGRINMLILPRL